MIIKFQDCSEEQFNTILLKWKQTEIDLINKYKRVPYVSILVSRRIIILHDVIAVRSMIELLIENSFFAVVCSIVYVVSEYSGGYGGILVNGDDYKVYSSSKYHFEIINVKEQLYFKSNLVGIDTQDSTGVFIGEFQLKLIEWDLLFSMENIGSISEAPVFFEKMNGVHLNTHMIDEDISFVNEELWNDGVSSRYKLIYESYYNGSLIDFILKIEVTDQEFGLVYPSQRRNELFSSNIRYGLNHSNIIDDCHLNLSIRELSKSTFISTKKGFEKLDRFFFQITSSFKIAQSKMIFETTNSSVEEIWKMINNPLFDDTNNFKNINHVPVFKKYILFLDCETTSIHANVYPPRLVSLSWALTTFEGVLIDANDLLIKPKGFVIDDDATRIHGISNDKACELGVLLDDARGIFEIGVDHNKIAAVVGHNLAFDIDVLKGEKFGEIVQLQGCCDFFCTMKNATKLLKEFESKWPRLDELFYFYFNRNPQTSHNSLQDVHSTMLIYFKMVEMGLFPKFSNFNEND
jgi:DNA polymerase III epsilon subunit-like protein